jgi:predicted RNase H-like HicB family nuclease
MYRVDVERDESGAWIARVPDVPGCHTYGRSLRQVRRRIREALSLWVDDASQAQLDFREHLPADVRRKLTAVHAARQKAGEAQAEAMRVAAAAVQDLTEKRGLSVRDAADLMGVSHQRVQQLASKLAIQGTRTAGERIAGPAGGTKRSSGSGRVAAKSVGRSSRAAARRPSPR